MYLLAALLYLWYTNKILLLSCWGCPVPIYSLLYCIRGNPVHGTMLCTDRAGTLADVSQVLHNVSMSPCRSTVSLSHYSHCSAAEMEPLCFSLRPSSVCAGTCWDTLMVTYVLQLLYSTVVRTTTAWPCLAWHLWSNNCGWIILFSESSE